MSGCRCWECLPWRAFPHGMANSYDMGCRCGACTEAKGGTVEQWRSSAPEKFRANMVEWERRRKRRNNASRDAARNWKKQWSVPELEIASRTDLSAADAAALLGRTIAAVYAARRLMRQDPDALDRGFTSHSRP